MRFYATTWDRAHIEWEQAFDDLANPQSPQRVYACTTANLPDPALFVGCMLRDTTTNTFKYSDGSTWS